MNVMDAIQRENILHLIKDAHAQVEQAYLKHPAAKGELNWPDKRRLLLADFSLHMAGEGVQEGGDTEKIKRYLYALLTICQDFMPEIDLTTTAEKLVAEPI